MAEEKIVEAEKSPAPQHLTIQELASASRVSVASIKFYLRENLLPPGDPSRPRRAYYDASHVRRLAVIRALREVGGLSIEVMRRALSAVDTPGSDAVDVIAPAIDALAPSRDAPGVDEELRRARRDVTTLFERAALRVRPQAGSRETLARTLAALRRTGNAVSIADLEIYLDAMRPLARTEVENEKTRALLLSDKEGSLEIAVLGTVLYEPLLVGMRRALHEHMTAGIVREPPLKRRGR